MKRWQLALLIFELALFAAILVLPQVALPDFTFHNGTAPVAAHARVCDPTAGIAVAVAAVVVSAPLTTAVLREISDVAAPPPVHSRLSRLCVLIC
jgi:ABC-type sulfate transport system permease subunit